MRHFRDTLEWTSGDRHSIHAVEESIEHILYYKRTRTDAEDQLMALAPQSCRSVPSRGSESGQSEPPLQRHREPESERTEPALQTGHTLHVIVLQQCTVPLPFGLQQHVPL